MARIGFRLGPFYFSQRLGRTQAQKRAAAKAAAGRRQARASARAHREFEQKYNTRPPWQRGRLPWPRGEAAKADHDARTYRAVISGLQDRPAQGRRVHHRHRGGGLSELRLQRGCLRRAAFPAAQEWRCRPGDPQPRQDRPGGVLAAQSGQWRKAALGR